MQNRQIKTEFWYVPNANTLFFLKNDWDIKDYSSYNHTMQWYWTAKYSTLSTGRKVLDLSWNNLTFSNQFTEANNKTKFTLHQRIKLKNWNPNEIVFWWRTWRNKSWTDTWDRWWARFQSDSAWSRSYILAWPNSTNWINTETWWSLYTSIWTSEFALLSATVNWWTYKLYKNWTLVWTYSSSTIRWWSSIWPRFYLWWCVYPDWTLWLAWLLAYIWEAVLEDKVETDAQVLDFYNRTKKHYQ